MVGAGHKSCWGACIVCMVIAMVFAPVTLGWQPRTPDRTQGRIVEMPEVEEPEQSRLVFGVVHRVIDGDSVELFLDGRIVAYELAGADAPEVLENESVSLRGSEEARDYLLALLEGEQIAVLNDSRRPMDARGRKRGYLYRMPDGLFVNLEMLRLGFSKHARDPAGFNNPVMMWAQDRARDARKGVWSPDLEKIEVSEPAVVQPAPIKSERGNSAADEPAELQEQVPDPVSKSGSRLVVYITKSGTKYHTKDCQHARESGVATPIEKVRESHDACKVCKPDDSGND